MFIAFVILRSFNVCKIYSNFSNHNGIKLITKQFICIDILINLYFITACWNNLKVIIQTKSSALELITNCSLFQHQSTKLLSGGWTVTAGGGLFQNVYDQCRNFFVLENNKLSALIWLCRRSTQLASVNNRRSIYFPHRSLSQLFRNNSCLIPT